jgi:imidazolonepropionase-like amidohydrolase
MFDQDGKTGILLNVGINADVLITNLPKTRYYLENESYYKGKHVWSAGTLVTAL